MKAAFDLSNPSYNESTLMDGIYHGGWWRRRHATSYDAAAFEEKIKELEGDRDPVNCTSECSFCNSSDECCEERYCHPDTSLQPLEIQGHRRVCQSTTTICAPRTPEKATSRLQEAPENVTITSPSDQAVSLFTHFGIAMFIFATILIAVIFAVIFIGRRSRSNVVLTQEEIRRFFEGFAFAPVIPNSGSLEGNLMVDEIPYDKSLELAKDCFEIYENQILGVGNFGIVVKGRVLGDDVAVKTTHPGVDKQYLKALLTELKVLMYMGQHGNIVNLLGAHTPRLNIGKLHIFLELCPLGNLLEYLRIRRCSFLEETNVEIKSTIEDNVHLTCQHLVKWSCQIANALGHLASKKVIHADIAAGNILVFSVEQVKLTDFGLSRRLYEYSSYVRKKQALQDLNFSAQSDVWAFGVTLWEIFSLGMVPYPGYSLSLGFVEFLIEGTRLQCPKHAHPLIYEVMSSCWTNDVKSRPKIGTLETKLVSALNELFTNRNYLKTADAD